MASFSPPRSRPEPADIRRQPGLGGGGQDVTGVRKPFRDVDHVGSLLVDPVSAAPAPAPYATHVQAPVQRGRPQQQQVRQHPQQQQQHGGPLVGGRLNRREAGGPAPPQRTEPYATAQSLETRMAQTAQLENQMMQFNLERQSLESRLARIPSHPKTSREREEKTAIESRLGYIDKSISQIRFVLRDMHVLE